MKNRRKYTEWIFWAILPSAVSLACIFVSVVIEGWGPALRLLSLFMRFGGAIGAGCGTVVILSESNSWQNEWRKYCYFFTQMILCMFWGYAVGLHITPIADH